MKLTNYVSVVAICVASITAHAEQISESDAMRVAKRHLSETKSLKGKTRNIEENLTLAYTAQSTSNEDLNCYYVFNRSNGGYVVVGADDCANSVLATIDEGSFDYNALPENAKWWFDGYASQISQAMDNGAYDEAPVSKNITRESIPAICKAKWNQTAPFNNSCPQVSNKTTYAGCVGVALAQILNHHKWPERGTGGQHSYTSAGNTITLNFDDVVFDWDNITDTYDSNSTEAQKKAVADLIYACGVAVNTTYTTSTSSASEMNVVKKIWKNLGYAETVSYRERWFYTATQWEDLIYNELSNNRPVLYTGGNIDRHAFVCDGYNADDDTYHFNWGWGGAFNGYFKISALKIQQGSINYDFEERQTIIIGIQKPAEGQVHNTPIFCTGNYSALYKANVGYTYLKCTDGYFTGMGDYCNDLSNPEFYANLGIKLVNLETGEEIFVESTRVFHFNNMDNGANLSSFKLDGVLKKSNSYEATGWYKVNGSNEWKQIENAVNTVNSVYIHRDANGAYTYETPRTPAKIEVKDLAVVSAVAGSNINITAEVENVGETDYDGVFAVSLVDTEGNEAATFQEDIHVPALTTEQVSVVGSLEGVSKGNYSLQLSDQAGNVNSDYSVSVSSKVITAVNEINNDALAVKIISNEIVVNAADVKAVDVFDMAGHCIYHSNDAKSVNIANLSAGVYVVKVMADGEFVVKQFIKK